MLNQLNAKMEDVNILAQPQESERLFRHCLRESHSIGQPAPLIREIKADEITALKERFAGRSANSKSVSPPKLVAKSASPTSPANDDVINKLEVEIAAQGGVVRKLKEAKAEKDATKAQVDKLLDLKKQLALAQGQDPNAGNKSNSSGGKKKKK
jgi:hypothetical protein